jgi:hypothetical protein
MDNRAIVERLWREHLVFASYIARTDLIRFSFALNNTEKMVNEAVNLTRRVFESCKSEANRGLSAPYLGYNPTANSIAMMNYVRSGNQSEPFVILP